MISLLLLMAEILHQFIGSLSHDYKVSYIRGARFQPSTVCHYYFTRGLSWLPWKLLHEVQSLPESNSKMGP